ncbi:MULTISPECIES: ABC transporter ATP-binding protein [unclassified Chelatococcus]|uniref:ABC transporter ATP-binding protein n=1 Tax=unclassified Chelatococcus TaxID=2638111 RepID=UPI001BCFA3D7|nr:MULTISPECIES: ABC transporter ATP-binding protein [unclassified Chelatococcus]MBS7701374.1 ABC transporter ATP-binding protein [Chelatococcus sp. YT9]MBX3557454.1 ABC transporter ATP-binding protein [Chelatococcus sp.]
MSDHILELRNLRKSFGAINIIQGVDLAVRRGERHAIIGPNGAGKSTLFNLISGLLQPSSGEVLLNGQSIGGQPAFEINRKGLSRSFQVSNIFANMSVYENVRCGVLRSAHTGYAFWKSVDGLQEVADKTRAIIEEVGLSDKSAQMAALLPYADQRTLEIAMTIAGNPDVVLLDEPTAGMSNSETERAVALIDKATRNKTLLIVEHDMSVVFGLADRISVLVYGKIIATGTPAEIRGNPAVREAYLGEEADHIDAGYAA